MNTVPDDNTKDKYTTFVSLFGKVKGSSLILLSKKCTLGEKKSIGLFSSHFSTP